MAVQRPLLVIALGLFLLAAGLRFFRLGEWSFHGDELAMLVEIDSFATPHEGPLEGQTDRLPRLIPLSYGVQWFGCQIFGRDEWGARAITALLGSLHVVLIFVGLRGPLGFLPALVTALLTAVWPEHLYRSQENRFYMTAAFSSSLCMIAGAQAVARRSFVWTGVACLAGLAAVFAHTLQAVALPALFAAIGAAAWSASDRRWDGRLLSLLPVVAVAGIVLVGVAVWHVLPLARGWNGGQTWGYGVGHGVLAAVSQLGWPVALLAALGLVGIWKSGGSQGHYWAVWALVWGAGSVVLPMVVSYHPAYVFPLSLGALVLAGRAVAEIYKGLRRQNALAGPAWLALACLLNLPSLVSHYADGSRYDFRSAAQYVGHHWQVGDRVATFSATLLKHYSNPGIEPVPVRNNDHLKSLAQGPDRLWIVVPSGREGKPADLTKWLGQHCSQQLVVRRNRYDYYDNVMEVFLYAPEAAGRRVDGFAGAGGAGDQQTIISGSSETDVSQAEQEVTAPLATRVRNGHILDQTVFHWMFEPHTAMLNSAGRDHLTYLSRRRLGPDPFVYVMTAGPEDFLHEEDFPQAHAKLDGKRVEAVRKYLNARTSARGCIFQVTIHDPAEPYEPAKSVEVLK